MTSFNIINDDLAVRGLQQSNKTPVISSPVLPVKASNPMQKSHENHSLNSNTLERRNTELLTPQRRQYGRRKMSNTALLDTRSQHDRRTKTGRSDDIKNSITPLRGIDEIV